MTSLPLSRAEAGADVINELAALTAGSHGWTVRQRREKVATATQACHALIFAESAEAGPEGLSLADRLWAAQQTAEASGLPATAAYYAAALQAQAGAAPASTPRLQAIARFASTIARDPLAADRQALLALQDDGLTPAEIVLLAQLIGYVAYQLRVAAGVAALDALGPAPAAAEPADGASDAAPFVHPANLPPPGQALRINGYTSETLGWRAWLPVVDPATATPLQQAVLDASHPKARTSDFYLLLVHQPRVLEERSAAFNAIMYAPGGLARAERELATAAVSRVNGCVYCLSVHAQRFEQLAKRNDVIAQLFQDPETAGTSARERAIVQFALALTRQPGTLSAASLLPLRQAGLSDLEVLDAIHASALFAWANRLMLNLGEAVLPD